jgi:hypothetical protein
MWHILNDVTQYFFLFIKTPNQNTHGLTRLINNPYTQPDPIQPRLTLNP